MHRKIRFLAVLVATLQMAHAQNIMPAGYQVQNKASGLLLLPLDANGEDGTPIVVYPKTSWRCLTWELRPAKDSGRFLLQNYFTSKTFEVKEGTEGAALTEIALDSSGGSPSYRFLEAGEGYYRIEAAPGLVLTVEGEGANARVVLRKWKKADSQKWKLLPKPEKFAG